MMKRDLRFSRRALLKGIGAGVALLPLLEADPADAQCLAGGIKRLYVLAWPDGMLSSTSKWATPGTTLRTGRSRRSRLRCSPINPTCSCSTGSTTSSCRDGPHSETTGHACYPGMLTGALYQSAGSSTANDVAGGPSIDQFIGSQLKAGATAGS